MARLKALGAILKTDASNRLSPARGHGGHVDVGRGVIGSRPVFATCCHK